MAYNHRSNSLSLCTLNCWSIKSSIGEICSLCDNYDMVFIQEHWLLPSELNFLSSIHTDFFALGHSSVDTSSDILFGRPYGGTGIPYRRSLSSHVVPVDTSDARLTAIVYQSSIGPILFVCVYMPTDYGDSVSLESYVEICANVTALYNDCEAVHLVVAGDFNCQPDLDFLMFSHNLLMTTICVYLI